LTGQVEQMLDSVFGPARFDKASYLFREGVAPVAELSYVAMLGDDVVGTIRYWPILVGATHHPALLLGPLGITPRLAGKGIGRTLTFRTLERAAEMGFDLVLLVGDVDYYKRFGFRAGDAPWLCHAGREASRAAAGGAVEARSAGPHQRRDQPHPRIAHPAAGNAGRRPAGG
jgi:predicted N-acetyltransferase YhbS